MLLHLYRQPQPWADTTITRHPPGCLLLTLPDGVADPGVWGQLNSLPTHESHWAALTFVSHSIVPQRPSFHLEQICTSLLTAVKDSWEAYEKKWGECAVILSNLAQAELQHFLCTDRNRQSLTSVFTLKVYPFFEYLQFPIKILTWRDRCDFIGSDFSNPFLQFFWFIRFYLKPLFSKVGAWRLVAFMSKQLGAKWPELLPRAMATEELINTNKVNPKLLNYVR